MSTRINVCALGVSLYIYRGGTARRRVALTGDHGKTRSMRRVFGVRPSFLADQAANLD